MDSNGERRPELLQADKEQLDRAAELLRRDEPGLIIVVCSEELLTATREHVGKQAGVEIPEPVVLRGPGEVLGALMGERPELPASKVWSLTLGGDKKEALRALNWNREKLLRGAPVLLWVDGVDALTELRESAPDAYAFRNAVVIVRGDGGRLPQAPSQESHRILEARRRLSRATTTLERAAAYAQLSSELRFHSHLTETEDVARRGLEALPPERFSDERARSVRAGLWSSLALAARQRGSQARQRHSARQGLDELNGVTLAGARDRYIWLLTLVPGPYAGGDRSYIENAFALAQEDQTRVEAYTQATRMLAGVHREFGATRMARNFLARLTSLPLAPIVRANISYDLAKIAGVEGRLHDVESLIHESTSLRRREEARPGFSVYFLAHCWLMRGELDTAEKVGHDSLGDVDPTERADKTSLLADLALARGNIKLAFAQARAALRHAAQFALDRFHLDYSAWLARAATETYDAALVDGEVLHKTVAELEVEEDVSRAITNNDAPPWYPIRFLGYRAHILVRTNRRTEALDLARRALDLARSTCEDLIPETGRVLADHLLHTGKPDEALLLLADVEPEAVSRGILKELAHIRADRVLALVLRNEPTAAIEPAMAALREALESTGAPRIKAETLQELAIRLPPATTLPDPLALAGETHTLFVGMPMPAKEARSLELAGDVLAARGKPADAKRRYLTAKGILERRGLGLRLPLLSSKIERIG